MAGTAPTKQNPTEFGKGVLVMGGGAATADNDLILEIDASSFDEVIFGSTAGAIYVRGSLDGVNYFSDWLAHTDMGAGNSTENTIGTISSANKPRKLTGTFKKLRFHQQGATAVENFGAVFVARRGTSDFV